MSCSFIFDKEWHPTSEEKSFGHDIESSWLITEAANVLKDPILSARGRAISLRLAEATLLFGSDRHGGIFEKTDHRGVEIIKEKHWWPQAEAVVGFLNAWELSGEEKYLIQSMQTWHFIQKHFIDRENGEWHWLIDQKGKVDRNQDKAGPWKAPYHNIRMCLEVCDRLDSCIEQ
ncbi:MAG: AGE family epimerase/isomerase [Saprospiraceae bacterium]|nr:AGE family epimerase/isomerase [Saprospiraceae bacterium]